MKKLAAALFVLCAAGCTVYAETTAAGLMSISQIELSGYIMLGGAAAALIGILFLLISLLVKVRQNAALTDEFEIDEAISDDAKGAAAEGEGTDAATEQAEEPEENGSDENNAAENEPEENDADVTDEADGTDVDGEAAQEVEEAENSDTESVEEENSDRADAEEEDAENEEAEADTVDEPEPEKMNVRITMTGINNAEVKVVEFADLATVGRRSGNTLMLSDRAVSGTHCRFTYSDGAVWLEDLDSTNGTVLNDEKIKRAKVGDGDIVLLGKNKFRLKVLMLNDDKQQ
ncbi:MAG: FHA domain-containing protein [Clostridia bacterium]|nr:FHA domain-containing protein [Clostridia bacterium]